MPERPSRRSISLLAVVALTGCTPTGSAPDLGAQHTTTCSTSCDAAVPGVHAPRRPSSPVNAGQDTAAFAGQVVRSADKAAVHPQLLMAILYNESYKPHAPAMERAWQRINPDAAFGIANMHKATFDGTKRGRDFADRDWTELPDDPALAIEAAAWYLHDLAGRLPTHWSAPYAGARPGTVARSYLDDLRANWTQAGRAIKRR
jgi:hypothetical protein